MCYIDEEKEKRSEKQIGGKGKGVSKEWKVHPSCCKYKKEFYFT